MPATTTRNFQANYYAGLAWPTVVKSVNTSYTGTTLGTLWTPASGKKFRLLGGQLQAHVTTVLAAAAIGDYFILCDNVVTVPLVNMGVMLAATAAPGSIVTGSNQFTTGPFASTNAAGQVGSQNPNWNFNIPGGYLATAADNVLKCALVLGTAGTAVNVVAGVITVVGTVWGFEE